jgi:hypothetical protein
MTSQVFVDYSQQTPVTASWLNDINVTVYQALGAGGVAPTTAAQVLTNLGLSPGTGASLIGTSLGDTVEESLNALHLTDYTALRAYTGHQKSIYITGYFPSTTPSGIAGTFVRDDNDTTSTDNGGTVIVASNGKRWKRAFTEAISVDWFGAVSDGVTDSSAAVRSALDSIGPRGGVVEFKTAGPYLIGSVVYIPQRTTIFSGPGIVIRGKNTSLVGSGANTIFESGTGQYSTVALGGATNFGQANESVASIHYNSRIEGFNFSNCGSPLRLFNWLQGCGVKDIYATAFSTFYFLRCFYLDLSDVIGRPLDNARAAGTPIFWFDETNNTITFNNVRASGITSDGLRKGIGFMFSGGVEAITLPTSTSMEGCVTGLSLTSFIYDMIVNSYFEANNTHIDASTATILHMDVDDCWFNDGTVAIAANNWVDGRIGNGNNFQPTAGTVTLGAGCTNEVYLPAQPLTEVTHTTWKAAPTGWTINAGCEVIRNDIIYNSAGGFSSPWFRNAPASSGGSGIAPMAFTGACFNVGNTIPYSTTSTPGGNTLQIDTKIAWSANLATVKFDILVNHTSASVVSGELSCNNTIFRLDAGAFTVTSADNGSGLLRLTLAGFGAITSYSGKVRII